MRILTRAPTLSSKKASIIRGNYIASQWLSTFCSFAGTSFSYYEFSHPHSRNAEPPETYIWSFAAAIVAATIYAYTANKFQGTKIDVNLGKQRNKKLNFPYHLAPRTWKSNLCELFYLLFATIQLTVNNYFLLAAIKAYFKAFDNPNKIYPLIPLSFIGGIILLIKNFGIDLPFCMTNAYYEAAEEIKDDITNSKEKPLVSRICKPLTSGYIYTAIVFWIKSAGVLSHSFTDCASLFLCIPVNVFFSLYQTPFVFWTVMSISTLFFIPLLSINLMQTLYFEATESEINLKKLSIEGTDIERRPDRAPPEDKSSFLRSLIRWKKETIRIRYGFFTQAPLHAFGDVMSVSIFLRDVFDRLQISDTNFKTALIVILATYVFIGSTCGTHASEVKTAIDHFDKDFKDLGPTETKATSELSHLNNDSSIVGSTTYGTITCNR